MAEERTSGGEEDRPDFLRTQCRKVRQPSREWLRWRWGGAAGRRGGRQQAILFWVGSALMGRKLPETEGRVFFIPATFGDLKPPNG